MTGPGLHAERTAIVSTAALWGDQAAQLRRAAGSVEDADVGTLGSRVAPAASLALAHWRARLEALARAAEGHGSALLDLWRMLEATDGSVADGWSGGR